MLNWLIDFSLRHRALVILAAGLFAVVGAFSLQQLDIDAFPDTTPVQIQINTVAPSLASEEIERQITFPVEQAISGLPGLNQLRSISKFGLSQVVVIFDDGIDIYFARQLINERLSTVELPAGISRPQMGPVSTGLGEVFHYVLVYDGVDFSKVSKEERVKRLTELRTIHDWVVKPQLRSVRGVAEVNSWGGYEKQYQVRLDPERLFKYGLTFEQVSDALQTNNENVGGGTITDGSEMLLVHGVGRTVNIEEIKDIVITSEDGVPIRVRDVADVQIGHEIRRGAVTANGRGEAVLGLGFMLMGENSHDVTWSIKEKIQSIQETLPAGVKIQTVYDRTELIDHVIHTVQKNLFEGGLLVVAVLFIFLGNLRAGLIVAMAIPLSMLFAFSGMLKFGIAASLLSLGAIDFGLVVDSSVVMIENCVRHLAHNRDGRSRLQIIRDAAVEVRKPTMFGELIIMIVYLPILTLEGIEGKLFRPMAMTVIMALAGSMVLSLTLMPVLASLFLPKNIQEKEPLLIRVLKRLYAPVLRFTMHHKAFVIGSALLLLVSVFGLVAPNLGSEFVPRLSEGAITINVVRLAGTTMEESIRYNTKMEQVLLEKFPDEIAQVWSRIGTAEVATDPMGTELTDLFLTLHPRERWMRAETQEELTKLVQEELRDLPGPRLAMSQPIEMRMNEMISGVRSDVAAILYGDDLDLMVAKASEVERALQSIPGAEDVKVEQVSGQPVLQIRVKQDEIARYGITASTIMNLVRALGTHNVGEVYEGQLRFPLIIRLPEKARADPDAIRQILVATPSGERIPLSRLATIEKVEGPNTIKRDWYQRRITIEANVRGRDLGSFVAEAQRVVDEKVQLPAGRYRIDWGGQFENLQRAQTRLMIVVPVALLMILSLLYMTYRNWVDSFRVFTGVPFAWIGGILALWIRDMPFSISAAVGFIALSGVAVLDDMLLVSTIRLLRRRGRSLDEAVEEAAMTRLRPILMTTLVASLGFVPMAFSTGMGAEVQRPLATVVIGGVCSAMIMSLLVLRVLYVVFNLPVESLHKNDDRGDDDGHRLEPDEPIEPELRHTPEPASI
ncbi:MULTISPECIES: efflux RND transporter permease subunit [Gimesia]|jgi:cobalt-zinc-cadmium resistance protein CzcA|uniref:Efflux RND transporter permease subunit n=2 Tax=Gimesia TaxID=1649453 RepID=A0A6I6AHG4_9PLAN|nr:MULTISPECIES: CusA/CzcA family heavy metal efflux RND transporter [Gimesia]MBP71952.1 CusA/CzcA family heavy metal efflux RND transporter [Haliea sp.]QDT23471.1 Cobalt-zinc-cadmium resistance protein CzcA [Gimesia chilikensis]QGQ25698.1 efflux RND transporter permease subunit [Gimesia benthica]|tara:strand:+ start:2455 stop:5661 length:3207 start_codon:yes stop_codon:yes gene_type:complete